MVLINIYVNTPLCLLSQFDVSYRIFENGLKCFFKGEHAVKENGGPTLALGARLGKQMQLEEESWALKHVCRHGRKHAVHRRAQSAHMRVQAAYR